MNLTVKMKEIADTLIVYDKKTDANMKDWQRAKDEAEAKHRQNTQTIDQTKAQNLEEAERRKSDWDDSLSGARNHMEQMEKRLAGRVYYAANGVESKVVSTDMDHYLDAMRAPGRVNRAPDFRHGDNDNLIETVRQAQNVIEEFRENTRAMAVAAAEQYEAERQYSLRLHAMDSAREEARYTEELDDAQTRYNDQRTKLHDGLLTSFRSTIQPKEIRDTFDQLTSAIPTHDNYTPPEAFPPEICFGYAGYEITDDMRDEAKRQALYAGCGYMIQEHGKRSYLKYPYGYSLGDKRFSTMFEFNKQTREQMIAHMQSIVLRVMMSNPANKAWLTMIDPMELGKTFSMFAPLGKDHGRVIDTLIWHEASRIEERLQAIIDHTSDVNFRCLQGKFENILQYNEAAGKTAEPLRFLIVMDFPRHFTPAAIEKLETIVTNGPSTGVYALIAADVDAMNESGDPNVQRIREKMNVFPVHQDALFTSDKINGRSLRFFPMICSEGAQALQSVEKIGSAISEADKVVIGLTDVYDPDMMLMSYDASNGITIPIGLEGAHARVELKLGGVSDGGKAHTYHAMLGGTIGSGKTAMLHNIIMGTLMCYNPNEVQVYLIDMKDGVEFKRYAPFMELANLRIVAIDAEKEFGLAVLKELTREQGLRAQKFKETATSRIEAYNEKMRREGRMNDIMPRLVVVMDEIQWLFDKEEDPIVKECVNCMRTLILQGGSAFGIQMILATQDWANVKGLDEGLYNNIGVRIALKNTKESAQTILRSDNDITDRLAVFDAGQAVFNEYAGHRDYNHEFRGIWVPREEAEDILTRLLEAQKMNPYLRKPAFQRLLSADVADNDKNTLNIFAKTGVVQPDHSMSYRMMVGEGLTIRNNYHPTIKTDRGQNMLLVGSSETIASRLAGFAAISAIYETIRLEERITSPVITVFDFIGEQIGEEGMNLLPGLMERLPEVFRVFRSSELNDGLQILENEMNSATDSAQHFVIFFGLNRARRLNDTSAYAESPRDRLVRLVQEGPAKGINFIVWANAPGVYQQMYGDILGCFEHRLVFDNTDEDLYPYYVQDKKPEQADKRNALSFNLDGDNMLIKLYSLPSSTWLDQFVASVRKYLG